MAKSIFLLFCLMSIFLYLAFIRYDRHWIGSTYFFKDPPIVKTTEHIKTTDSSQIVKEKSTELVSKFGLDFELFYNVRNALRILQEIQIILLNFQEYS